MTINALGSNSAELSYGAGASLASVMTDFEGYITTHGWTVYDAAAGTNKVCYRAMNYDAASYKYITVDWNTSGYVLLQAHESWDSGTHTATNTAVDYKFQATTVSNTVLNQRIDLASGGKLNIFCKNKYIVLFSDISAGLGSSQSNSWTGVFEISRDNAGDTAANGVPPIIWMHGGSVTTANTGSQYIASFCRTVTGGVGFVASQYAIIFAPGILMGSIGYATNTSWDISIPIANSAWTGKAFVSGVWVGILQTELRGQLFGAKFLNKNAGGWGDTATISVDVNGFFEPTGTSADHHVLPTGYDGLLRLALEK